MTTTSEAPAERQVAFRDRLWIRTVLVGLIGLFLGIFITAAIASYVPSMGTAPSIYDDFNWSSISDGFWHVNTDGGAASIRNGYLYLSGHQVELDHRIQTDPLKTIVVAKVRGLDFFKFAVGLGTYHGGTVGLEFDNDGFRCGRGTDQGWQVDDMRLYRAPPTGEWYYLKISIVNPYPGVTNLPVEPKKPVLITCSVYDASGHLVARDQPMNPRPNTRYPGVDEVYLRTWDSHNLYQVDWFYAGPVSGDPTRRFGPA